MKRGSGKAEETMFATHLSLFGGFHVISCDLFIMFIYSVGLLGGDKGTVKNGRYQ